MASTSIGNLSFLISANALPFDRELDRVRAEAMTLNGPLAGGGGGGGVSGLTASLAGGAAGAALTSGLMAAAAAAGAVADGVRATVGLLNQAGARAVQLAGEFQLAQARFGVMLGSDAAGTKLLGDIEQLAIKTPFNSRELTDSAGMLLGMGVSAEAVLPALSRLGDIAAGDTLRLQRLMLAAGQVAAAGKFMGSELRQFTEAGVGVADFAAAAGKSTAEFRAAMESGQVGADVMWRAINRLTSEGGRFFGMNDKASQTVPGQWNALTESVEFSLKRLGLAAFEALDVGPTLGRLAAAAQNAQGYIGGATDLLQRGAELGRAAWAEIAEIGTAAARTFGANKGQLLELLPTMEQVKDGMVGLIRSGIDYFLRGVEHLAPVVEQVIGETTMLVRILLDTLSVAADGFALVRRGLVNSGLVKGPADDNAWKWMSDGLHGASERLAQVEKGFSAATQAAGGFAKAVRESWQAGAGKSPADNLSAAVGQDTATGGAIDSSKREIPFPHSPPPAVMEYATKLKAELAKGITPVQQFHTELGKLNAAVRESLLTPTQAAAGLRSAYEDYFKGIRAANATITGATPIQKFQQEQAVIREGFHRNALSAGQSAAMMRDAFDGYAKAARDALPAAASPLARFQLDRQLLEQQLGAGLINGNQFELNLGTAFGELEKVFQRSAEVHLPGAMRKGTQEAESVISKAMTANGGRQDPMARVVEVLRMAYQSERNTERHTRDTAKAVQQLKFGTVGFTK